VRAFYFGVEVPGYIVHEWTGTHAHRWKQGVRAALGIPEGLPRTGAPYPEKSCESLGDHGEHIHNRWGSEYWCRGTGPFMTRHGDAPQTPEVVQLSEAEEDASFIPSGCRPCTCTDSIRSVLGYCPPRGDREYPCPQMRKDPDRKDPDVDLTERPLPRVRPGGAPGLREHAGEGGVAEP